MTWLRQQYTEMFAHAVIAAAATYGDDPVLAMIGSEKLGNVARRSLHPAGEAVRQRLNWSNGTVAACLGLNPGSFKSARMKREGGFNRARAAAAKAIEGILVEEARDLPDEPPAPAAPKVVVVRSDPPVAVRTGKPVVANRPVAAPHREGSLGDRIYAEILQRPLSANSLATILDVKEMNVINSLRALALEGAIVSVTGGNESSQKWHAA